MIRVLTIGSESESAKRLGLPLHIAGFKQRVEAFDNHIIIRWGCSNRQPNRNEVEKEFANVTNPSEFIIANCHKYNSMKKMSEVVNVPKLYTGEVPAGVTAVVRKIAHAAGSDFAVKKGRVKLADDEYGSEFLSTETEVRVWFCNEATMMAKRVRMDVNEKEQYPCRANWGYKFCYDSVPDDLHRDTLAAAKALGLEYGAADILKVGGKWYFLELNTAPSIDLLRLERFFKANIMNLLEKKFGKKLKELADFDRLKKEGYPFPEIEEIG